MSKRQCAYALGGRRRAAGTPDGSVNLERLSGESWVRLLTEMNMGNLAGWCAQCEGGEVQERMMCQDCGASLLVFDPPFWKRVGVKIRRAIKRDRTLLSRVKAEWETLNGSRRTPSFPGQLEWLITAWQRVGKPAGRPFEVSVHYRLANWIADLRALGLSNEEIVDILGEEDLPDGPIKRGRKDYANLPGKKLRELREGVKRSLGYLPGGALHLEELWRIVKWVERQRDVPMARLRGERIRARDRRRGRH